MTGILTWENPAALTLVVILTALTLGCSTKVGKVPHQTVELVSDEDQDASVVTAQEPHLAEAVEPDAGSMVTNEPDQDAFKPPYPNRGDPFRQPDFRKLANTEREQISETQNVQLKGFLNVGELRALVAIDGQVSVLKTGDEKGGIRVIQVAPPQIVLQRGRLRWTEALYQKTSKPQVE